MIKKKKNLIIVFIIFFWLFAAYYLQLFYKETIYDLKQTVIPTIPASNYTVHNAQKNLTLEKENSKYKQTTVVSLRPGEQFKGKLAVKNHSIPYDFVLEPSEVDKVNENEEKTVEQPDKKPHLEIVGKANFHLDKNNLKFFDYTIKVPKDVPTGNYKTTINFYPPEAFTHQAGKAVQFIMASGLNILIEVTDNPRHYKYTEAISNPYKIARERLLKRTAILASIFFASLAALFTIKLAKIK